ncbi:MAG: C39 family peptidase, partial [Elusimicrobia bacterium]|nr:C39 family peptidase [Elusimicrobiota bacterium]
PFDDLVGSWNAKLPPGGSLELQARVRRGADWSKWFSLGRALPGLWVSAKPQESPWGLVDIDTLRLKDKAQAFQYRFLLTALKRPVTLIQAAVTVSNGEAASVPPFRAKAREIKVAPRSQCQAPRELRRDICSPTSLAMALGHWGVERTAAQLARKVRDSRTGIFGHWAFNVAGAADCGVEGWVARLGGLEELAALIEDGRPVVASLSFGPGKLAGSPLRRTSGHLVLVTGFDKAGDVIVLDPAAPRARLARRVYARRQFHAAWMLNKRGLAYVLAPLRGRRLAVGAAVADLMAKPRRGKDGLNDAEHLSQLLYGETVLVERVRGDWVLVTAEQQPHWRGRRWAGYRGWLRADALTAQLPGPADCVVRTRQALVQRGRSILSLSVGTRLSCAARLGGIAHIRLLDGSVAELPDDDLLRFPARGHNAENGRSQLVKTAELFLGTSYYWGGRSGVQRDPSIGVDCSGLSSLAYRVHGLDIPRDAQAQWLRAKPLRRSRLKRGDLVFLSEPGSRARVSHVMLYTGGDGLIESRKSAGRALRSSFKERFGRALRELENGDEVLDLTLPRPRLRRLYFGRYL